MDDEEDVKKIIEVLNCTKTENAHQFEYDEFINCEDSDVEEGEELLNNVEDDYLFSELSNTDISSLNTYDPRSSLKPDERVVIDSCCDPELKNLLLLNRTKNIQLIQLYKKMKDLLMECQRNIKDKNEIIKAHVTAYKGLTNSTGAWRLAAPYFKDKQLFSCPPNADVLRKTKNNELSVYELSPSLRWSSFECEKLIRAVKLNYNINQQNAVEKRIENIKQNSEANAQEELEELQQRLNELKTNDNSEVPPLGSNEHIDWMRVADVFLKDKHSAFECKSMWHIYLHPQINKSPWTHTENTKLKELVKKYDYQNWDQIANDLGTNRTCFTACMNYYGTLHENFKKGEFTYEEDAKLLDLVYQYRMGSYIPWVKIVQHFKDRTRSQIHCRYTYYLSQNNKKKGKFTDAEDILLMILVDKFGKNFKKCCKYLPTRSMVQCKSRYNSNLQNSIKKGSFTIDEDKIIMKYVEEHGTKSWTNLTKTLRRSRGQIRQRYHTIKQFLDGNPELTIDSVPRRKHNLKSEEESFHFLRILADQYRNNPTIPSLEEIEKLVKEHRKKKKGIPQEDEEESDSEPPEEHELKPCTLVPDFNVDNMLTDFFCNSFKIGSQKCVSSINLTRAAKEVAAVLDILNVDLDIPDNFKEDHRLDSLDVAILNTLVNEKSGGTSILKRKRESGSITELVPPNLNSVVGLRSLLIKFSHYKSNGSQPEMKIVHGLKKQRSVSGVRNDIAKHLLSLPTDLREQVENDRKLFYKRFYALFKWPAIMTLESPSVQMLSTSKCTNLEVPLQVKRTYSKVNPSPVNTVNPQPKRIRVTELPKVPPKVIPLKLTPVTNKSVIEDLLRNKNKKLFCFNQVKCGDVTKTIIKEVPMSDISRKVVTKNAEAVTKKSGLVKITDISATISAEPGSSRQEQIQFDMGQSDCSITEVDDGESIASYGQFDVGQSDCSIMEVDYGESIASYGDDSGADDEEDVKKLDTYLTEEYHELQIEDDDLRDLKKLNIFLKNEKKACDDSNDDESTLFG